jgi:hypothetical protein
VKKIPEGLVLGSFHSALSTRYSDYLNCELGIQLILKIIESEKLASLLLVIADSRVERKESVINLPGVCLR